MNKNSAFIISDSVYMIKEKSMKPVMHVHPRKQKLAALYMPMAGQAVQLLP
jgi:hypothetical protein